jgi:hypothetical protein
LPYPEINDWIIFGDGRELHGAGHYHETYEKRDGSWRIKTLHLWATPVESPNIAAAAMKSRPADTPVSSWGR